MLVKMFGGDGGFEREIKSSAAKTALSTFLFAVKTGPFVCECSQVELRELIYASHREPTRQSAASQQTKTSLQLLAYTGSPAASCAWAALGSGGRRCSGVFPVKDIKCRQADVENFLLTEDNFVTL
jgi:hypothetical protein